MGQKILGLIGAGLLSLSAGCAFNQDERTDKTFFGTKDFGIRPFVAVEPSLNFSNPVDKVSNVPEVVRDVPIHRDDGYVNRANQGPIAKDSVKTPVLFEIGLAKVGLETKITEHAYLDVFGNVSLNASSFGAGDENERNYTNAVGTEKRGYGAALTYWRARYGPLFIPGLGAELRIPLNEGKKGTELLLGGTIRRYNLEAENGWDRWNKHEKYKTYRLGEVTDKTIYTGILIKDRLSDKFGGGFKIGADFADFKADSKYPGVKAKTGNPSYFISVFAQYKFW